MSSVSLCEIWHSETDHRLTTCHSFARSGEARATRPLKKTYFLAYFATSFRAESIEPLCLKPAA
ncbi:MAG: hypothetical protein UV53_C0001G0055 [Candidatus Azambacteria bacterium GW2011_GWE1_42_9]|nr:MAG: hypothetical protein UV39_C0032G0008 [Candidatus Azambacteria bacterium GW2011_GWA2_42_62]KKS79838.1 MAG: hypothetical protein UV53_C0001G0055 [Candidatus Azambacteria bacterium GW2011_GWE1_42_9]KKT16396.1 MAG: hypothetical protein UV99_C0014G0013 [Parcubacteria group bacterium GW2011_GWC1_43_61]